MERPLDKNILYFQWLDIAKKFCENRSSRTNVNVFSYSWDTCVL